MTYKKYNKCKMVYSIIKYPCLFALNMKFNNINRYLLLTFLSYISTKIINRYISFNLKMYRYFRKLIIYIILGSIIYYLNLYIYSIIFYPYLISLIFILL